MIAYSGIKNSASVVKTVGNLMLVITSNSYEDREKEWLTTEALTDWVDSQWDGDVFNEGKTVSNNPFLYNHKGITIGRIVWADMFGPFLVEVARKRQSLVPAFQQYIDTIWDRVKRNPKGWGASHKFSFKLEDRDSDGTYHRIRKVETTVLRRAFAANLLTLAKVV